jgi:RNA polymerase sigma-70 factor (ECF subfamily)
VEQLIVEPAPLMAAESEVEDFEALYRRTSPRVYAYAASLLRDRSAAEEVTAQAFERAYRKRRSYRPRRGTVDAWLFGIVRNAALDELRRRLRRADLEAEPADPGTGTADDQVEGTIRRHAVRAALRGWSRATASSWRSSSPAGSETPRLHACWESRSRMPAPAFTAS